MAARNDPERGARIRAMREAAGISQRELARRLAVHYSNISFWERSGTLPRSHLLAPMARELGVDVGDILGEEAKTRRGAPLRGRARLAFDAVSQLPKRKRNEILSVVDAFVAAHANGASAS